MATCTLAPNHVAVHPRSPICLALQELHSSLQDSEILLRLLGEAAPDGASMEPLMHVDLTSRACMLIRCISLMESDLAALAMPLEIVHAFLAPMLQAVSCGALLRRRPRFSCCSD